jgi:acetylornithine deacetylase/succinyl-diaminopimelate desuccinylase-like protein
MDESALHAEVIELTQALIGVDTTNGNETAAAEVLRERLDDAGVDCAILGRDTARGNLVARIPGTGEGPSLAFVGHLDVVPSDARDWTHPPFAAEIDDDGYLFGRGAVDMKNEVAIRTVAMLDLARDGFRPKGDLLLVMVADEEDGSAGVGMKWLVEAHPEIRTDYSLNEGGGARYRLADGRVVTEISVGEKGTCPVLVEALGEAGRASMPSLGRNAVPVLGELLHRVGTGMPTPARHEVVDQMLEVLLGPDVTGRLDGDLGHAIQVARELSPMLLHTLPAVCGTTMAPTLLTGSAARNVMPARAGVELDCRALPGTSAAEVEQAVRDRLGHDLPYRLSFPEPMVEGSFSSAAGPLWEACASWLSANDDAVLPLATMCTGFTDSVYLRQAFGTSAYGFCPTRTTPAEVLEAGVHNRDERVHVDDLLLGVRFHRDVARRLIG